jgi:hypothetical protein
MAADEDRSGTPRPTAARPLVGYRDVGEDARHSRGSLIRAWIILLCLALFYLGWTLTVYFLEPGLR